MKDKAKEKRDSKGRFVEGNVAARKHGAYSLARTKNVPSIRGVKALARYLDRIKSELEGTTQDINVKKELLINQIVRTEEKMRLMDMWIKRTSLLRPDKARRGLLDLQPCLYSYLAFMNTQRQALMALGLNKEKIDQIKAPYEILKDEEGK